MEIFQHNLTDKVGLGDMDIPFNPDIFFLFVSPKFQACENTISALRERYPHSELVGCSTAGEISGYHVNDESLSLTAVKFDKTKIKVITASLTDKGKNSYDIGLDVSKQLQNDELRHILFLSDGLHVNGGELVRGLRQLNQPNTAVTGALAADGTDFGNTFVITSDGCHSKMLVAIGFYGADLKVGYGSHSGWDSFGIERNVTKSKDNVLYELDGQPALSLYKSFLGKQAKDLPGSALLFPLSMRDEENKRPVIRTILGIDEDEQSLTFAGNIPQGSYVRLMKANIDRLIEGAAESARITQETSDEEPQLAFLFSCVGRKVIMKQLVEEEVEAVREVFDDGIYTTGFYSYGEIGPFDKDSPCDLHNQTMSITSFAE